MSNDINDDAVGETPMEATHIAGLPVKIKGERLAKKITVEIRNATDFSNLIAASGPGPTDEELRLEQENDRLRAELLDASAKGSAAAADTATARLALRMAIDQHDHEIKAMKRVIAGLFSTIAFQTRDIERLAAAAVAREYAAPVSEPSPESDDDWAMPGGLPRGVR